MKKKILLFSALVFGATAMAQTQLTNASFEDVHQVTVDRTGYSTPAPVIAYDSLGGGWVSGNEIFKDENFGASTNTVFAKDTSDAVDGSHALLLRTHITAATNVLATGNTGIGTFELSSNPFQSVKEGMPFADRPDAISGKYKYYNNQGDSCLIASVLTKWNGTKRDTVGMAIWTSTNEVTTYTDFSIDYTYWSNETPDTISVMFLSSKGGFVPSLNDTPVGQNGATLIIDDLSMDYTSSIEEVANNEALISVLNNEIRIELAKEAQVQIVSLEGKVVYTSKIGAGVKNIALNQTGLFLVNVTSGTSTTTKKVVLK